MDVLWMALYLVFILSVLVFVHEGGHFLVARAFKVRVTEFMLGFPGPNLHVTWHGTKFGITCVPLGGYARVCGMEPGEESPHLRRLMALAYERGALTVADAAAELQISEEEARDGLDELYEWGTLEPPAGRDKDETFRTPEARRTGNRPAVSDCRYRGVLYRRARAAVPDAAVLEAHLHRAGRPGHEPAVRGHRIHRDLQRAGCGLHGCIRGGAASGG